MAGEQDIYSLGLNIESFNEKKKLILKEYIAIFENLIKYDGKIFNPVMGDGLVKFNTSIQETNRLLDEINTKLLRVNSLKIQTTFPTNEIRRYTSSLKDAGDSTDKFSVQTGKSAVTLEGIGKNLTHALTTLRYIAFLIPGLGIAGIFNVIFQAIGSAVNSLVDFGKSEEDVIKIQDEFNKSIKESVGNLKEFMEIQETFSKYGEGLYLQTLKNIQSQKDYISQLQAEGIEKGKILQNDLLLSKEERERAGSDVTKYGGIEKLDTEIKKRIRELALLKNEIYDIGETIARGGEYVDKDTKRIISGSALDKKRTALQGELDIVNSGLKELNKIYNNYYSSIQDNENKKLELQKFNSDQARKLLVETNKENISLDLDYQKSILDNDKKFYDDKKAAILQQYRDEVKLAEINRINVTGTKENQNVSATPAEIQIAINKQSDEVEKARIKKEKALEKNDVEFYQRKIKSLTESNKDELEKDALSNERIFQNEQKSLSQRLDAYGKFVYDKMKIQEYEYSLDIQRGSAKAGGITSLTPEERNQIEVHNAVEKANVVANAEKQVYDIVYSSLRQQIKDTEDAIQEEGDISKLAYIDELEKLNERLENKKISLLKYQEEKKKIDEKYTKIDLDEDVKKDEFDLQRLEQLSVRKIFIELQYRQKILDIAKKGGNQDEINKAQGAFDAAEQAQIDINKKIEDARERRDSDRLKRAKNEPTPDNKIWKDWVDQFAHAFEQVDNMIEKAYDERIRREEELVQKRKELIDEQLQYEQDAIEKSSLSSKDKQALEIQIQAQKLVNDKDAAAQEKRLKIEEFDFNKKIQLANAFIGVAAAIIKDGLTTPKSIADAIIGAVEIGIIASTQPPSFGEGVTDFSGGIARYGESGPELVKKPGHKPFVAISETIGYLPKGTDIIPLRKDSPEFSINKKDESWEQTKYLAKQIKSNKQEIKNYFRPTIVIDLAFESRKREILGK